MTPKIPREVQAAWDAGNKIEAIKLLREATGLGLAEAKSLLDAAAQVSLTGQGEADASLPADVQAALARGNKIEAIRLLRATTGLGLKDAKDRIDAAEAGGQRAASSVPANPTPGLSPGEVPRTRVGRWAFLLVFAALVLGYWLYRRAG
ncbi:MAG: ribosomal protein L7/L12 [Betaproteobacteria bacterium]|nr:ribosomal protein L7/L12 [Betaproteobacteria bacterium]